MMCDTYLIHFLPVRKNRLARFLLISSGSGASLDGRESSRFPTLACGGNEDFSALSGPYPECSIAVNFITKPRKPRRDLDACKGHYHLTKKEYLLKWVQGHEFIDILGQMQMGEKVFEKKGKMSKEVGLWANEFVNKMATKK